VEGSNVLIMGLTFKENCPDIRNTRVVDIVEEFQSSNCNIDVYDPWVDKNEAAREYSINPIDYPITGNYDVIILAVAHDEFQKLPVKKIKSFGKENFVLYDIKYLLREDEVDGRL
jgi:UDP-N-acetyl-D-glucosamine/UDP-N-acetyl-D-galactosamine dehydrogenase